MIFDYQRQNNTQIEVIYSLQRTDATVSDSTISDVNMHYLQLGGTAAGGTKDVNVVFPMTKPVVPRHPENPPNELQILADMLRDTVPPAFVKCPTAGVDMNTTIPPTVGVGVLQKTAVSGAAV